MRADLTADDVISLINALALAATQAAEPPRQVDRLLELNFGGLRTD